MITREAIVHVVAAGIGIGLVFVAHAVTDIQPGTLEQATLFVVGYGLVFAGGHAYLAVRGVDGMVPVAARWRYLGALGIVFGGAVLMIVGGDSAVGALTLRTIGGTVIVATICGYVIVESIAGYRAARTE